MKHVMASLTIAACLLLPSAGGVLGANPSGKKVTPPGAAKQPNQSCQNTAGGAAIPGNSGNTASANSTGSPFGTAAIQGTGGVSVGVYAGAGPSATNAGSTAAVSQYDVACFGGQTP
jgi:hypothetical protein